LICWSVTSTIRRSLVAFPTGIARPSRPTHSSCFHWISKGVR